MAHPSRRNPARLLAPAALVVAVIAFIVVLSSSGVEDKKSSGPAGKSSARQGTSTTKTRTSTPRRSYTIKVGDTLGAISEKTGIPVEKLQELNPQLDPQNLVAGQKIKLRE